MATRRDKLRLGRLRRGKLRLWRPRRERLGLEREKLRLGEGGARTNWNLDDDRDQRNALKMIETRVALEKTRKDGNSTRRPEKHQRNTRDRLERHVEDEKD